MLPVVESFTASFGAADSADGAIIQDTSYNFEMVHRKEDEGDKAFMTRCKQELNQRLTDVIEKVYPKSTIPSKRSE